MPTTPPGMYDCLVGRIRRDISRKTDRNRDVRERRSVAESAALNAVQIAGYCLITAATMLPGGCMPPSDPCPSQPWGRFQGMVLTSSSLLVAQPGL
jgi:hypothetical protein